MKPATIIRLSLLLLLFLVVFLTQHLSGWAQVYAAFVYPAIGTVLSSVSSVLPFSLGDVFITLSIAGILVYPFYARRKRKKWWLAGLHIVEYLAWVYVWFYLAWGLNYSQPGFYARTNIKYSPYEKEVFVGFLNEYIAQINTAYAATWQIDKAAMRTAIMDQYRADNPGMGVHRLTTRPRVKHFLFSPLFSKMGVSGYMGPFFIEFNVNAELPLTQYPATYAHELAHLLGITSEAEANFYAYYTCTRSTDALTRFSGYLSVFGHVMSNARGFLPEDEYREMLLKVEPGVLDTYNENSRYWNRKYSTVLGSIQSWVYELYLKGNKIPGGRKNYSEVVGLLISWWNR